MNIKQLSVAEQLFLSTVKITTDIQSSGTGFFFTFNFKEGSVTVLVTNKHVVGTSNRIFIKAHTAPVNGELDLKRSCIIAFDSKDKIEHPSEDLCIFGIGGLSAEKCCFFTIDEANLPTQADIESTDFLEEVYMVGCPDGLFDDYNNIPLMRRGITASPLPLDFQNRKHFLTDIAAFPGSSGSPILIYDRLGRVDKKGNLNYGIGQRLYLIGILVGGYEHPVNSDWNGAFPKGTPTPISRIPNSLGIAIKSSCLLDFKPIMAQILATQQTTTANSDSTSPV